MSAYDLKTHPAFSGYDLPEKTAFLDRFRNLGTQLTMWSRERRAYNEAFDELQALSDRDLADIGIARSDIPAIARETAKASLANA